MMRLESYTVRHLYKCYIIEGPVPINDMVALMRSWAWTAPDDGIDDEWIVDADLAARMGATIVCGQRRDIAALRKSRGEPKHAETPSDQSA